MRRLLQHIRRRSLLVITGLILGSAGQAQDEHWPDGFYLSLEKLQQNLPTPVADVHARKRTNGDIEMNGGNDYRLESSVDSLSKKYLKSKVFAFAHNDSLFLNGAPFKVQKWYALALTHGPFIVFRGGMSNDQATGYAIMGGAIGGAIAAKKRYLYVLSLRTGHLRSFTTAYLQARLKETDTKLLAQYMAESNPESEDTLIDYTERLNKILRATEP